MWTRTWLKNIERMTDKAKIVLAQKMVDLGENVKVTVGEKRMIVTGVGRYDEEKNKVLRDNGFTDIDDYECEHW